VSAWSNAPIALRAYVVISVAGSIVGPVAAGSALWVFALGVAFALVIAYFLLQGIRWLWYVIIAFHVLTLPMIFTFDKSTAYKVIYEMEIIVGLILLLAPETRRYFRPDTVTSEPQS
jgi:hypothetical protein